MRKFSVAPMMACTDRHYRYFARIMSAHTLLYTEMITQDAIIHGDTNRLLYFDPFEHPVALQLGGSDPKKLALCAKKATQYGYDEINLNVGCPSDRVQSGQFGACLLKEPSLVADCVAAMKSATTLPITVKTRTGVDHHDSYDLLAQFAEAQKNAGIDALIVHARKAWLNGLSPRDNRNIPPLNYDRVYRLKMDFPDLDIVINGGIKTLEDAKKHLEILDGVMVGRAAYYDSFILTAVDQDIFNQKSQPLNRDQVYEKFKDYLDEQIHNGYKKTSITKHLLGLHFGQPGARNWRRSMTEPVKNEYLCF